MDDPCWKILPAALAKYKIPEPWNQYSMYIIYGDQEQLVGLEEEPLKMFKQLDKEGKNSLFMLRKNAQQTNESGYEPPGGVI